MVHNPSVPILKSIARLAYAYTRTAITVLRVAARKATEAGLSSIPARLVEESVFAAGEEIRRKTISKLNQHQRIVFEVLESEGPLIQKELYKRYFTGLLRQNGIGRANSMLLPKIVE